MDQKMIKKLAEGRQYRKMEPLAPAEAEEESMVVRGYATTFNQRYPLYEDENVRIVEQVDSSAFEETSMDDVILQYDHQGRVFARKSNNTLSIVPDEHGLLIEADLSGTRAGRDLYEEIKGGYTSKMSFGFTVAADKVEEEKDQSDDRTLYVRTIQKIGRLFDVSAVSLPANDYTEISARSFVDGVIAKAEAERLLAQEKEARAQKIEEIKRMIKGE